VTWPLRPGRDVLAPYYRDVVACFRMGMTAYDVMLSILAKAEDPASGGRQTPGHFSSREHLILSRGSPVASQLLWAAGVAYAARLRREPGVLILVSEILPNVASTIIVFVPLIVANAILQGG